MRELDRSILFYFVQSGNRISRKQEDFLIDSLSSSELKILARGIINNDKNNTEAQNFISMVNTSIGDNNV